jgi:hypothetical protein
MTDWMQISSTFKEAFVFKQKFKIILNCEWQGCGVKRERRSRYNLSDPFVDAGYR